MLVVANTAVLALGVGFTAWILSTAAAPPRSGSAAVLLAGTVLAMLLLGVVVNAAVVHFALTPLRRMEETATRIDRGREDARVGTSNIADPELSRLMRRFDQILDTLTEARERQQVAASLLVDSEERVRMRIADELYGDVGQRLAAVLLLVGRVARRTPEERASRESAGVLDRIQDELAQVLESIRRTARDLRPPELNDLGIMAAIQAEVRTVDARSPVDVTLKSGPADLPLGDSEGLILFRLIQDGLSRVLEGTTDGGGSPEDAEGPAGSASGGACVTLIVDASDDAVRCDIESDGPVGPGLEPMRERATWIGGSVRVLRGRSGGNVLRIRIPASRRCTDPGGTEEGGSPRLLSA